MPGNDDAVRAIQLYCEKVATACRAGADLFNQRIEEEGKARVEEHEAHGRAPLGKRVVEITQPARRPARLELMLAKEELGELAEPEGEAPAAETPATTPPAEAPVEG